VENGIVDLQAYLAKPSYDRLKLHFYLYERLYTYNFEEFKYMQLNTLYGKKSHYDKVHLLFEQGYLKSLDIHSLTESNKDSTNREKHEQIIRIVEKIISEQTTAFGKIEKNYSESNLSVILKSTQTILALKERLYAHLFWAKKNMILHPTLSLDCYGDVDLPSPKSDIYRVLINNIPVPDKSVPLVDIIQYRDDESNKLRLMRLKTWVRKLSTTELTETQLIEEIDTLIAEYKNEMKIAGMKMEIAKMEFAVKVLPHLVENILKLNLSKLAEPWFKLKSEKISLLDAENKAKGNELSYILRTEEK